MPHKVFICHSSKDKLVADAACAALEAHRIPCWIAPRDIAPGVEWGGAIVDAITDCQIVLLIFSQHANDSPDVRREINLSISEQKDLVPFRIQNVAPTGSIKYAVSNRHWLDAVDPPMEHRLGELSEKIARILNLPPGADPLWTSNPRETEPPTATVQQPQIDARDEELARLREIVKRQARGKVEPRAAESSGPQKNLANNVVQQQRAIQPRDLSEAIPQTTIAQKDNGATPPGRVRSDSLAGAVVQPPATPSKRTPLWKTPTAAIATTAIVLLCLIGLYLTSKHPAPPSKAALSQPNPAIPHRAETPSVAKGAIPPNPQGKLLRTLEGHTDAVHSVAFSPDGHTLASAADNVRIWDLATGKMLRAFRGHAYRVDSVAFSPDGRTLASGGDDNIIKLFDPTTGDAPRTLRGHAWWVWSTAFSPDGRTLASGSGDNTVKLWDLATGQTLRTLKGPNHAVLSVAFSPDGRTLASGNFDNTGSTDHLINLWDVATGLERHSMRGHTGSVFSVAFSPDSRTLASASTDNTIKLWDASTGQELLTLRGHTSSISSVAFSPDGRTLASASDDKTIRLWNAVNGQQLLTLRGHSGEVFSVAFSPDGNTLASGSYDKSVKLWDVSDKPR
jgi:WD40 repeat protein